MREFQGTVALALLLMLASTVMSQDVKTAPCTVSVQSAAVGFWTWTPGSTINVYVISSDFNEAELEFLLAPLSTWNSASASTGSRVRFDYKGQVTAPLYCENCLTIRRGQVFDKSRRHLSELKTYSAARDRTMTWAIIVIDPLLTVPKTLTNAVAHELGHSFGLLDCYSCVPESTVMLQFKSVNVSNGMEGPSRCDVVQVKKVYEELARQPRRSQKIKSIDLDEGEDPIDDDTPIVVPQTFPGALSGSRTKNLCCFLKPKHHRATETQRQ